MRPSSTLQGIGLGKRAERQREVMLSRLGIAEEPPRASLFFSQPEEPPLVAPKQEPPRVAANDEHATFTIPEPPVAPEPYEPADDHEEHLEAIRRQFRKAPGRQFKLPTPAPRRKARAKTKAPARKKGSVRRKAGEMAATRRIIWLLAWLAAATIAWAMITLEQHTRHPIVAMIEKAFT
jgi:hypothetical protein